MECKENKTNTACDKFKQKVMRELNAWHEIGGRGFADAREANSKSILMEVSNDPDFWIGFISGIQEAIRVVCPKKKTYLPKNLSQVFQAEEEALKAKLKTL